MRMILANVRTPEEREGDLLAQMMANRRGEERLREIVAQVRPGARAAQHARAAGLQRAHDARSDPRSCRTGNIGLRDFLDSDGVTRAPGADRGGGGDSRRFGGGGFHRLRSAGGGIGERQLRRRGVGGDVCVPLPDGGRSAVHRRPAAADPRDRAGAKRGERRCCRRRWRRAMWRPRSASRT